ncbi:type II secretion system F family protein [Planctomicrobium piriforme]|uniref:General secretion pathway protein F n=1 Tax=Planctomicrobium piriforme TaxID=1576369 RepID=A0A1I3IJR8_9PLAN|nr:type II secretion system F family protein [Planctomicrobium piriforme]SFI48119.1 general secretion pathway protein F/type IV pilus assembly protein PilC [Planctomicrobium piriforme]
MPDYQYTAREMSGQQISGTLTATSEKEALASLASKNLFPIRVDMAASSKASEKQLGRRVPSRVLAVFYSQLADLLRSGVPLLRSLELLSRQSTHPALKVVVQDVRDQVADGSRLYDAMRQHPKAFNELMISMVRAGEEGGFLEDVLKRIADFTEHQEELKGRVIGAMVYPIFLLSVGGLVVAALMVWFVPRFEPIFDNMKQRGELPWTTSTLLAVSNAAESYWLFFLIAVGGGLYGLQYWLRTPQGQYKFDEFRLKAIGLGPISRSLAIARFCRVLGTLLRNGVPVLNSLKIAKDATGNRVLTRAIDKAAEHVSTGRSLARPLGASGHFPEEIVEMIAVGEEANNLENVLIGVSENLERRTSRQIEMAVRLLEPILLLGLAAVVLFVVVALLLPIFESSSMV